jgi:asparagine synthetase A
VFGSVVTLRPQNVTLDEVDWSMVRPKSRATLERLRRVLQEVYAKTGMTEDELADYFDTTKPLPFNRDPES